ncbi:polyphosphatidylinositol phosphatase INP52 [Ditylenchus destructor]|uniref:Polyphosphatidylinositol phosphatase INP52 n=1 Tax=Ditylenchus destructor TaxID=166010 RepID=A0AAD4R1F5_9BILA|nr:polyphosphatidylinositol phosphatase INP52 [Ditylenchus destructor]
MIGKIILTFLVIQFCICNDEREKPTPRSKLLKAVRNLQNIKQLESVLAPPHNRPTRSRKIGVFVTTFNTNAKIPEKKEMKLWLNLEEKKEKELEGMMPDLVVIGLQEIVQLGPGRATRDAFQAMINVQPGKVDKWLNILSEELNQHNYVRMRLVPMFGLLLVLYHRRKFSDNAGSSAPVDDDTVSVTEMRTANVKTGKGDILRNKGAVGISLLLNNSMRVCFVNAHLSHGEGAANLRLRNDNFNTILKRMTFAAKRDWFKRMSNRVGIDTKPFKILQHDLVIWMGDLNFRLNYENSPLVREQVVAWSIGNIYEEYKVLMDYDQLRSQLTPKLEEQNPKQKTEEKSKLKDRLIGGLKHGLNWLKVKSKQTPTAFEGFQEDDITFAPTYKFDTNTEEDKYDTSEKKRWPAWTDRILHWTPYHGSNPPPQTFELEQKSYESVREIRISDHRIVRAAFLIKPIILPIRKESKKLQKKKDPDNERNTERQETPAVQFEQHAEVHNYLGVEFGDHFGAGLGE